MTVRSLLFSLSVALLAASPAHGQAATKYATYVHPDFTQFGKSTRIFVRENGRWLCIHGHYTALP